MKNILVCVTKQETADMLFDKVTPLISDEEDKVYVVNIGSYEMYYMNKTEEEDNLDYLYEKALLFGATIKVIRSNNVLQSLINFIDECNISHLIMEDSRELGRLKRLEEIVGDTVECIFVKAE